MIYDYNVWTDTDDFDVWSEDSAEALRVFIESILYYPERPVPFITRYPVRLNASGLRETVPHEHERIHWYTLLEHLTWDRDHLHDWKQSAMEVLDKWDQVWEAAGKPGMLGTSKAVAVLQHITAIEQERDNYKRAMHNANDWAGMAEAEMKDAKVALLAAESRLAEMEAERDALAVKVNDYDTNNRRLAEMFKRALDRANAAESRLASARVEGAREALTRFHETLYAPTISTGPVLFGSADIGTYYFGKDAVAAFRDREYPAPAAPAGEQTRPVPTPEPEPLRAHGFKVEANTFVPAGEIWVYQNGELVSVIRGGSRPTQTAEGQ